jgi:hypothetical protein
LKSGMKQFWTSLVLDRNLCCHLKN